MQLDAVSKRRLANFRANRRALWSLRLFSFFFILSLFAELIANDRPLAVWFQGELLFPVVTAYPETRFGGEFETEADYHDPFVVALIRNQGAETLAEGQSPGRILWAPIRFDYATINKTAAQHPAPPSAENWLGTDDQGRDVLARVIYGFRISVLFGLFVTTVSTLIGVALGAVQGYFGGWLDLLLQRVVEIWTHIPQLYLIMIIAAVVVPGFWMLALLVTVFGWTTFVGVVRAEFLRARNFEYVQAARALGVSDMAIMFRHLLPNAMVATVTLLPFVLAASISELAALDFMGFGLPAGSPSLGELALQGKRNLQAPWLGLTAFVTFSVMLSLLVFIFEGVRDAFDPRKTFRN